MVESGAKLPTLAMLLPGSDWVQKANRYCEGGYPVDGSCAGLTKTRRVEPLTWMLDGLRALECTVGEVGDGPRRDWSCSVRRDGDQRIGGDPRSRGEERAERAAAAAVDAEDVVGGASDRFGPRKMRTELEVCGLSCSAPAGDDGLVVVMGAREGAEDRRLPRRGSGDGSRGRGAARELAEQRGGVLDLRRTRFTNSLPGPPPSADFTAAIPAGTVLIAWLAIPWTTPTEATPEDSIH